MSVKNCFVLLLMLMLTACESRSQITTIILLRHAEKGDDGTKDPDLTPEGYARAQRIVSVLKDSPVDAVYSTNYKRTKNTVLQLASSRNLEVQSYEPFNNSTIEVILERHKGKTIVICGHSNTTPWIANLLTGEEKYKDFTDDDYNNLMIVSVVQKGKTASVTWLNID